MQLKCYLTTYIMIAQLCTGRYIRDECMYIAAEYGMNYVTPLTK